MAHINKRITFDQLDEIICAIKDEDEIYAHSGDSYDAGIIYGIELAMQALGFSVNRDEDRKLAGISW